MSHAPQPSRPSVVEVRCPVCRRLLFKARGQAPGMTVEIRCTCRRTVLVDAAAPHQATTT
jgi:phage FluMu protein Com